MESGSAQQAPDERTEPLPVDDSAQRYVLLETLGRGGMGVVTLAYDSRLRREVALKAVRANRDDGQLRHRLVREARAMAQLHHPNVVAVYDVVIERGVLTLVMEYVPGTTLKGWLAAEPRPWRDIVTAHVEAARGLQAAHDVGILHRDFKHDNVLVGDDGRVRVTDFGVARLLRTETSVRSSSWSSVDDAIEDAYDELTQTGRAMGTPLYMAPEQHEGKELDARADQYAFCLAMWKALTGSPPFQGGGSMRALLARKREGPPPWPSTAPGPRGLGECLRRGLDPDRDARWPSMEALALALSNVDAPTRRAPWLGLAALGVVGMAAGIWFWTHTDEGLCSGGEDRLAAIWNRSRKADVIESFEATGVARAEAMAERTASDIDEYADAWAAMHRSACEATSVEYRQSAQVLDLRMACLRRAEQALAGAIDVFGSASSNAVYQAPMMLASLPPIDRCADLEALQADVPPPGDAAVAQVVDRARSAIASADAMNDAGRYAEADALLDEVEPSVRRTEYGPVIAEAALVRGMVHDGLGRYDEARRELELALDTTLQWRQWTESVYVIRELGFVLADRLNRPKQALAYAQFGMGLVGRVPRRERAEAMLRHLMGAAHSELGYLDAAEQEYRRAIEAWGRVEGHGLAQANARNNLAVVLTNRGRLDEAEVELAAVIEVWTAELGPLHPYTLAALGNLGTLQHRRGDDEAAVETDTRVMHGFAQSLGPSHPNVATSHVSLAGALFGLQRRAEAERHLRTALRMRIEAHGSEHHAVADVRRDLGRVLGADGRLDEAEAELRQAVAILERVAADDPDLGRTYVDLAEVLRERGAVDEARQLRRRALAHYERTLPPDDPRIVELRSVTDG